MKESIKAALLDLPDVDSVTVYENRSDEIVDGMKPHSFEVIIHGGDDIQIAQTILEKGPIGIDSNGSIEMTVIDSEGTPEKFILIVLKKFRFISKLQFGNIRKKIYQEI